MNDLLDGRIPGPNAAECRALLKSQADEHRRIRACFYLLSYGYELDDFLQSNKEKLAEPVSDEISHLLRTQLILSKIRDHLGEIYANVKREIASATEDDYFDGRLPYPGFEG